MVIGIYILKSPTDRVYVGQSWNIYNRMKEYRYKTSKHQVKLYRSIKKWGFQTHEMEIMCVFDKNVLQEELDYYEQYYMDYYKNKGYNLLNIREGGSNGKLSEKTKRKISNKLKKIGNGRKGYITPKASKKRISVAHMGLPSGNKGNKYSKETLIKMSKITKDRNMRGKNHPRSVPIKDLLTDKKYVSITEASKKTNIPRSTIQLHLSKKSYRWEFL